MLIVQGYPERHFRLAIRRCCCRRPALLSLASLRICRAEEYCNSCVNSMAKLQTVLPVMVSARESETPRTAPRLRAHKQRERERERVSYVKSQTSIQVNVIESKSNRAMTGLYAPGSSVIPFCFLGAAE
jgi:hypothetical protein